MGKRRANQPKTARRPRLRETGAEPFAEFFQYFPIFSKLVQAFPNFFPSFSKDFLCAFCGISGAYREKREIVVCQISAAFQRRCPRPGRGGGGGSRRKDSAVSHFQKEIVSGFGTSVFERATEGLEILPMGWNGVKLWIGGRGAVMAACRDMPRRSATRPGRSRRPAGSFAASSFRPRRSRI
ncbi:MAG: hypothetical protein ABR878_09745 [Roseiarcus sp.]